MPKIIENLPQRLTEEARNQIRQSGYAAMTIRSVAKSCGVGVGTVYNYFPSKDALVAAFILEDWKKLIGQIRDLSESSQAPQPVLQAMYNGLIDFAKTHQSVFGDETAGAAFAGSFSRYHGLLRGQLSSTVQKFCSDSFTAEFITEAMLTWTMAGKSFDEIYPLVNKLF